MSGSPPPEERVVPQQLAGHRRKRSDTPPATTAAAAIAEPAPAPAHFEQATQRFSSYSRGGGRSLEEPRIHPAPYGRAYQTTQPFGYGPSLASVAGPSPAPQLHFASGQISPRATRKTKAHVASACVNCKKKHLRCDHARPCNRCVATGKENTCYDVEHKKRGRPPLKPEDTAPRGSFGPPLSPPRGSATNAPGVHSQTSSSPYNQPLPPVYQRDIRPLQTSGLSDYGRSMLRPGPRPQSMYAAPTVSDSRTTAVGTIIPAGRPFSGEISSASTQGSSSYIISPPGYGGHGQESLPRSLAPYGSAYSYAQQQSPMISGSQQPFPYPMYQRTPGQSILPTEDPVGLYGTSSLQLPPILPAPQSSFEPAMAQQQRQAQHLQHQHQFQQQQHQQQQQQQQHQHQSQEVSRSSEDTTRQPEPKRPRMDIKGILGPRNE